MIEIPKIELISVEKLKVDETNPNIMMDEQFEKLKSNIQNWGFIVPIITNKDLVIADGEHRLKAAQELEMTEVPVIKLELEEVDRRIIRQVMNKLKGVHDLDLDIKEFERIWKDNGTEDLQRLLPEENYKELLRAFEDNKKDLENLYTQKIKTPIYKPSKIKPKIKDLINNEKTQELIKKIESSNLKKEIKDFLKLSCQRFLEFNYSKIADYYAHSDKQTKEIMEELALVIIDFKKAFELGYINLNKKIGEQYLEEHEEE